VPRLFCAIIALITLSCLGCSANPVASTENPVASTEKETIMSDTKPSGLPPGKTTSQAAPAPMASRKAPPKIQPITLNNVRYEQIINGQLLGEDQRTGYLGAFSMDNNELLWSLKVYQTNLIEHLEADVQDVFFTSMTLSPDKKYLKIDNERNETFFVDLTTKSVGESAPNK
jgi:hypothetical protein